jgi:hypothetical protein
MIELPGLNLLDAAEKDALILAQAQMIASLTKRIAELEAKLGLPAKTPSNSRTPPSLRPEAERRTDAQVETPSAQGFLSDAASRPDADD